MTIILISAIIAGLTIAVCIFCSWCIAKRLGKQYKSMREIEQTEKYTVIRYGTLYDYYNRYENLVYNGTYRNCIALLTDAKNEKDENDEDELYAHSILMIDKNGNIIDSLIFNRYSYFTGGYIHFEDYYISWLIDGDKNKKVYRRIDSEPGFDEPAQLDTLSEWYRKSTMVFNKVYFENKEEWWRFYFYYDQQWWILDKIKKSSINYDEYRGKGYERFSDFAEGQKIDLNKGVSKTENINLAFFHRQEYYRRKWGLFPGSDTERRNPHWSGTGFFDISLNMETLKIKMPMNKNRKSILGPNMNPYITASSPIELFVFDNFDFYLLKDRNRYSRSIYLIKPK